MRATRLPLVAVAVSVSPLFVQALPQFFNGVILAVPPVTPPGQCATTGAHILTVRGLNEPLTNGPIQPLVNATVAALPGSDVTPVPYSASNGYPFYSASVDEGAANTVAYITQYAKDCPRSSIVVLGYSEGAQAVMSAVCGESSFGFTASTPLSTALLPNLKAIVVLGDPSHVAGQTYNVGNGSAMNGVFPRLQPSGCSPYASHIQSYCDINDSWCAPGYAPSDLIHWASPAEYAVAGAAFVVKQVKGI